MVVLVLLRWSRTILKVTSRPASIKRWLTSTTNNPVGLVVEATLIATELPRQVGFPLIQRLHAEIGHEFCGGVLCHEYQLMGYRNFGFSSSGANLQNIWRSAQKRLQSFRWFIPLSAPKTFIWNISCMFFPFKIITWFEGFFLPKRCILVKLTRSWACCSFSQPRTSQPTFFFFRFRPLEEAVLLIVLTWNSVGWRIFSLQLVTFATQDLCGFASFPKTWWVCISLFWYTNMSFVSFCESVSRWGRNTAPSMGQKWMVAHPSKKGFAVALVFVGISP